MAAENNGIIADVCERLIYLVFDNDIDANVKQALYRIVEDLKETLK
jgi:uncharacterized membrane protein